MDNDMKFKQQFLTLFEKLDEFSKNVDLKFDEQSQKISEQSQKISEISKDNSELKKIVLAQKELIVKIEHENKKLRIQVKELNKELLSVKGRLSTVEEKMVLFDNHLVGLGPVVRNLIENHSLMLESGYFDDLRENEDKESFLKVSEILNLEENKDILSNLNKVETISTNRGLTQSLGKRMADFYLSVTNFKPRKIKNVYQYWLEAEDIIVNNVLDAFRAIMVTEETS